MAYDVFISFKNTAPGGGLTIDRTIAERLHMKLRDEGLEVFFSERDINNAAFMDQVYRALDEAKLLILVGTSVEYINSEWVKSEWQNFLGAMHNGRKPRGQIITVLQGISTRDLPIEISNMQSFNAVDIDGIVDFVFKALGKRKQYETVAKVVEEQVVQHTRDSVVENGKTGTALLLTSIAATTIAILILFFSMHFANGNQWLFSVGAFFANAVLITLIRMRMQVSSKTTNSVITSVVEAIICSSIIITIINVCISTGSFTPFEIWLIAGLIALISLIVAHNITRKR